MAPRYRVEDLIGEGGVAKVFAATDSTNGARVAVKVLNPFLSMRIARERFGREIALCSTLRHPRIVPILESGEIDGIPFYIMPFHAGGSLRDRLRSGHPLDLPDVQRIVRDVTAGLAFAHGHDVIHRDIKPENILYDGDRAVIADFGLAKALHAASGDQLTQSGEVVGTPTYMSPEQALGGRDLTPGTDVYSLGCVIYEMLVGRPPFVGARPDAIVVRRLKDPIPSVRSARPELPEAVDRALTMALTWSVSERLQDVQAFGDLVCGASDG